MSRSSWIAWAPAVLYMLAIFAQSSFPSPAGITGGFDAGDKALHLVGYGLLGFLTTGASLRSWSDRPLRHAVAIGFVVAAVYGATDELHQAFVPSRSGDPLDLVADVVGAALGAGVRALVPRRRRGARS